jgi:hypothetical protein
MSVNLGFRHQKLSKVTHLGGGGNGRNLSGPGARLPGNKPA